jgi:hypothetical protein
MRRGVPGKPVFEALTENFQMLNCKPVKIFCINNYESRYLSAGRQPQAAKIWLSHFCPESTAP